MPYAVGVAERGGEWAVVAVTNWLLLSEWPPAGAVEEVRELGAGRPSFGHAAAPVFGGFASAEEARGFAEEVAEALRRAARRRVGVRA